MSTPADDFIAMPPGAAPTPPPPPAAAPEPDDAAFISLPPGVSAESVAPPAPTAPETSPTDLPSEITTAATTTWCLELPQRAGTVTLDGTMIVGRNPAASADWPGAALLALQDSTRTVSKSHAVLRVDGRVLRVHDLGSTNGVFVVDGERAAVEVVPGVPQQIPDGAQLELGDYVIRVSRA